MKISVFCKVCDKETRHMELDWFPVGDPRRLKCFLCGEYNGQKHSEEEEEK